MKKNKVDRFQTLTGVLFLVLFVLIFSGSAAVPHPKPTPKKFPTITLTKENLLIFRTVVTEASTDKLKQRAFEKASKLSESQPLYLVLDTPGGDVDAGNLLISTLQALRPTVSTVTIFAASMGFHITQNLGTRYVLPSGTYMSHRVSVEGIGGQVPGSAITRLNAIAANSFLMDEKVSKRLGMQLGVYEDMIKDEYWVSGEDAVKANVADEEVLVICDASLNGTYQDVLETIFGQVTVTYAECPLIRTPVKIDLPSSAPNIGFGKSKTSLGTVQEFVDELVNDKEAFVSHYIVNHKFAKILVK